MRIAQGPLYLLYAGICLFNMLGMFYAGFGAAAGGSGLRLLWPAIALFIIGALLLAVFSALRAAQVGLSPWLAAIASVLSCTLGPAVLVLVIYLATKAAAGEGGPSEPQPASALWWLQPLILLVTPWAILWVVWFTGTPRAG